MEVTRSEIPKISILRAEIIDRLGKNYADRECRGNAGHKSVEMWRSLALRLSEDISIGFEQTLISRLENFLYHGYNRT